jgi:LPXTG-motif cell wall-anchored protein
MELRKTDKITNEPLEGVELYIQEMGAESGSAENSALSENSPASNSIHLISKTNKAGKALFEHIPSGTWKIFEPDPPPGYASGIESKVFTVDDNGLINGNWILYESITNAPIQLLFENRDIETGRIIPGSEYAIHNLNVTQNSVALSENSTIAKFKTKTSSNSLSKIPAGDVLVEELKAPPGYVKSPVETATISSSAEKQYITVFEDFTKVDISKVDITDGQELPGAKLEVYAVGKNKKAKGKALYSWTSTADPHRIDRIPTGNYMLRETMAPSGYAKANDVFFKVKETGKIQKVKMEDRVLSGTISTLDKTPKEDLPKTGDESAHTLILLALAFVIFSGLGLFLCIKHLKNNRKKRLITNRIMRS